MYIENINHMVCMLVTGSVFCLPDHVAKIPSPLSTRRLTARSRLERFRRAERRGEIRYGNRAGDESGSCDSDSI